MLKWSYQLACRQVRRAFRAFPQDSLKGMLLVPTLGDASVSAGPFSLGIVLGALIAAGAVWMSRRSAAQAKASEARVASAEAELRTLLTLTDDAVLVLDRHGVIREANAAAEELFGRPVGELAGGDLTEVIPDRLALAEITRNGPANFNAQALRIGVGKIPVEVVISPVERGGERTYLMLTHPVRDEVEDRADLATLVLKPCHELNNQLTGILGNLTMVLLNCPSDGATRERVTNAKRSALRAQDLTRRLQGIARGETTDPLPSLVPSGTIVPMPTLPASGIKPAISGKPPRILIVDDEPAICSLIAVALEAMDYEVVTREDGVSAVDAFEEALQSGSPFSLVLSDLSLPGDLDGQKAVQRMRMMDPGLKAIISSGYDQDPVMTEHRAHGFAAALAKPFEMGAMVRMVRELLATEPANRKSA